MFIINFVIIYMSVCDYIYLDKCLESDELMFIVCIGISLDVGNYGSCVIR